MGHRKHLCETLSKSNMTVRGNSSGKYVFLNYYAPGRNEMQESYFKFKEQSQKVNDLDVIWKGISWVFMKNMKALSLTVQKL